MNADVKKDLFDSSILKDVLARAVEDCVNYTRAANSAESSGFVSSNFSETALPMKSSQLSEVYANAKKLLIDQPQFLNQHKGFMGWALGAGRNINMLSELIAAAVNASVQTQSQTAALIEIELGNWMKQIFSWPQAGLGYMVSGTAQGNLVALLAARHHINQRIKYDGMYESEKLIVIGNDHTHFSIKRAMQIMGLGEKQFKTIPGLESGKLQPGLVDQALSQMNSNERPLCVVATLGSTMSGAFDSLPELKKVCSKHKVWLHVDGAWGAWAKLDLSRPHLADGLNLADSLAFDFHKWPGSTMGSGMVLFKPETDMKSLFVVENPYLESMSGADWQFSEVGPDVTRPMRALAPWMLLQQWGTEALGEQLKENFDLAQKLTRQLKLRNDVEMPFETQSNTVVFRFKLQTEDEEQTNRATRAMAQAMWKKGQFMPSLVTWNSTVYLRFCLMNPAISTKDIHELYNDICTHVDKGGL